MGDFAVLTKELAEALIKASFELVEAKHGKYTTVYYFTDSDDLRAEIEKYHYKK